MRASRRTRWTAVGLVMLAAACNSDGGAPTRTAPAATAATSAPATSAPATGTPTPADGSLFPAGDIDTALQPWVDRATADLASRLSVDPSASDPAGIDVVSAVLVVWPDASLGCPEPDMQYAAVLTDGAVIELSAGGAVYRYHAGGDRTPFLCATPIGTPPPRL